MKKNLCIHFEPGARGDFLAGILLDNIQERSNGAVTQSNYKKIHKDTQGFIVPENKNYNNFNFIRIDDNHSTNSMMQIVFNQFLKNPVEVLDDNVDHFYVRFVTCFSIEKEVINSNSYDYWIDFDNLQNIQFLQDLYQHYHCDQKCLIPQSIELIQNNLNKQVSWKTNQSLRKLSVLIDFEKRFNLFQWNKTFSIQEYMNSDSAQSLLKINNYSRDPFVL
jgi:hypothetical protein